MILGSGVFAIAGGLVAFALPMSKLAVDVVRRARAARQGVRS